MGSPVPVQSKPEVEARAIGPFGRSRRARRRAGGSRPGGRHGRGGRPSPSGRTATCARCPSSRRPRARPGRPAACPGACAPSTSVSTPRRSSSRTSAATGMTRAVGDVTWLTSARRVRGVTASRNASTTCDGSADRERHPDDDDARPVARRGGPERVERGVVLVVAGEELVAGPKRRDARTVETPVVALGTNARPSGSAPRKAATSSRAIVEVALELAVQEADRLALQSVAPCPLGLQDGLRARPERPVVEEGDVRLQEPRRAIEGACGHAATLAHGASRRRAVTRIRGAPAPRPPRPISPARPSPDRST